MIQLTLLGAYGRTYATKEKALKDWNGGKDFKILNGPYCSIRDIDHMKRLHEKVCILLADGVQLQLN